MRSSEALSFLQHQIDLIAVPVFIADERDDLGFRFVAANSLYARLIGLPRDQLIGQDPARVCADPVMSGAIVGKYRLCLETEGPVHFRDRIVKGRSSFSVETTLQKIACGPTATRRIVGTALKIDNRPTGGGDIGFYVNLARNSLMTIEMLMEVGQEATALTRSEREATAILTRKALAALEDAEQAAGRPISEDEAAETGMAEAVRRVLLH